MRDWEFFYGGAVLFGCRSAKPLSAPAPQPIPIQVRLARWWPFFSLLGQGCIQLRALSQGCGGAIAGAGQTFRHRSETPWLLSRKRGATLAIRLRLCVFLHAIVIPLLELTLPKGELPSPCDRRSEGSPEGSPNRRAKAFLMGAISYDVPT